MTGLFSLILIACSLGVVTVSCTPHSGPIKSLPRARCSSLDISPSTSPRSPSRLGSMGRDNEVLTSPLLESTPSEELNSEKSASRGESNYLRWTIPTRAAPASDPLPNAAKLIMTRQGLGRPRTKTLLVNVKHQAHQAGSAILKEKIRAMFAKSSAPEIEETASEKLSEEAGTSTNIGRLEEVSPVQPHQKRLSIQYGDTVKTLSEEELIRAFEPLDNSIFRSHAALMKKLEIDPEDWKPRHMALMEWFSKIILPGRDSEAHPIDNPVAPAELNSLRLKSDLPEKSELRGSTSGSMESADLIDKNSPNSVGHTWKILDTSETACTPEGVQRLVRMSILSGKKDNLHWALLPVLKTWYNEAHSNMIKKKVKSNSDFHSFMVKALDEYEKEDPFHAIW
ncbi:hypothetical protein PGT21_001754 [Puccinia graminis f. sp. tritici]|uniref:Uncharacterized protein n=1 Tax=Puccinia graminis f. sp. tritici TaxID=56615 RepID=A0A5B0RY28_PUCGR|nr:hypothetical protein PGT21_001754 [Puccinia graminis f. sp. tritici]KAA1130005.1 hypothetical protein PGTUg99_010835 [Puccinia graminis f. sp. tritici]